MRRAVATITGTIAVLVLLLSFKSSPRTAAPRPAALAPAAGTAPATAAPGDATTPAPAAAAPSTPGAAPTTKAPASKSAATKAPATAAPATTKKTVSGQTVDTRYGPVQVQVSLSGATITDIRALQLPSDRRRSAEISQGAEPLLRQEALTAQSARIDTVSGATYTSDGYAQSLQSALDQARAG
ncbi:MAG: hypothetical protein QOG49_3 [Frankiaceae bacterium]|nr:hypothetical protein [Frankiaceae bacterium]